MFFDFPYTCPKIDKNIDEFKDQLFQHIDSILSDLNEPLYNQLYQSKQLESYINNYVNNIYDDVKDIFETVRTSNNDIRDAAECQLSTKQNIINDLESELDEYR